MLRSVTGPGPLFEAPRTLPGEQLHQSTGGHLQADPAKAPLSGKQLHLHPGEYRYPLPGTPGLPVPGREQAELPAGAAEDVHTSGAVRRK